MAPAWRSALGKDRNDIQEVTPEFYYLPDFLTNSNIFVLGEWWSEWGYLTDKLSFTAVLLNTCAMEVSYLTNRYHIYAFGSDKKLKKPCKHKQGCHVLLISLLSTLSLTLYPQTRMHFSVNMMFIIVWNICTCVKILHCMTCKN